MTVLDLGCGAGRDVYIASQLVGPNGRVIGVDMTEEQLATAREFQPYHAEKFGFDNVEFHNGLIEELDAIESLKDGSVDIIISNCVINLCPDKDAVLQSCHRLLKEGGELYFSVFIPTAVFLRHLRTTRYYGVNASVGLCIGMTFTTLVRNAVSLIHVLWKMLRLPLITEKCKN
eukprot:459510_1